MLSPISASADPDALYWAAVAYELAGDRERALNTLAAATRRGYSVAVIRATPDLNQLRKDPQYRSLLASQSAR